MDKGEARAALDAIGGAQAKLADVGFCPPWRHGAFGLIMAALVLAVGVGGVAQAALTIGGLAGVALVAIHDRRRYGVFINGYRRGPTLKVTLALAAATIALFVGEIHAREAGLTLVTKLALASLELILAIAASVIFARVLRRELTGRS